MKSIEQITELVEWAVSEVVKNGFAPIYGDEAEFKSLVIGRIDMHLGKPLSEEEEELAREVMEELANETKEGKKRRMKAVMPLIERGEIMILDDLGDEKVSVVDKEAFEYWFQKIFWKS